MGEASVRKGGRQRKYRALALAGALLSVGVARAQVASVSADAKAEAAPEPIDEAVVGPSGGVPKPPSARVRSPFAVPAGEREATAKVGLLLANVRSYDIKEGVFVADFYLSLSSDRPMRPVELGFTNGKIESKAVVADKPTFKLYHLVGTFTSRADIREFPFDVQQLTIEVEDERRGVDALRLVADEPHTNVDVGFAVSGYEVSGVRAEVLDHYYPDRFEGDDLYYGRYRFSLSMRRRPTSAIFQVYVPALVIVLISIFGAFLPRRELEVRSNAVAPMLSAAVIFHFTLSQMLPSVPYLTRADRLMLGVYASLMVNMAATWAWFLVSDRREHQVFTVGRWLVPAVSVACTAAGAIW